MKFYLLLFLTFIHVSVSAETFSFDKSFDEWGSWGNGFSEHQTEIGHNSKGSIHLSTDWDETQTIHYTWSNLKPGLYKVKAFVRGQNIQPHNDKTSFWHFYDAGSGTESVFTELNGSYDWRRVEYTLNVPKNALTIWFRLKSPGQVWIDDFSLEPASSSQSLVIENPKPLRDSRISKKSINTKKELMVLDFDKAVRAHPFSVAVIPEGGKSGKLASQKYYNFDPTSFMAGNWSQYDRIQMDLFNGNAGFVEFYLTVGDHLTTNYWSQLNHKTHLAPGWNHLSFSLSQLLGERGSHRFNRSLDLTKIKKWFIVLDHNQKFKANSNFFIDNIKFTADPYPVPDKGVLAFDFTSQKDNQDSGFQKVTTQNSYNTEAGFGFVDPKFWRVEDSQWVGNPLRYSIGLQSGSFKVDLPNGNYQMSLSFERLGYWDVSFWKDRTILLNGKAVFKESRSSGKDFLKDYLQFESIVPNSHDHPFDLYLSKIFKPHEFSFQVTKGSLDLEVFGDATGINLNSLIIWKAEDRAKAQKFIADTNKRLKTEFNWMTRSLNPSTKKLPDQLVSVIDSSLTLKPGDVAPAAQQTLAFKGGNGEKPYQLIQVRGNGELSWTLGELKDKNGHTLKSSQFSFYELIPQFISPDLNHETYLVAAKYLKPLRRYAIELDGENTKFVWVQLNVETGSIPGVYKGEFKISGKVIPVQVDIAGYSLPKLNFPVGFFGPDPITPSYFTGGGLDRLTLDYKIKAIKILGEAGFTTFSSFPAVKVKPDFTLDTKHLDEVLTAASRAGMTQEYFSYGGKFPQQLLNENDSLKNIAPNLKQYLNRPGMPKLIHTFSDEAGGYSDRVKEDVELGKELKTELPFMLRGGFGSKNESATKELNSLFDYGIYSNVSKAQLNSMKRSEKWGSYNVSPGNLDDPRFTFGPGLYYARHAGLNHYLEWHSSAVNNYPYYDLDGRESDVVMFMPTSNGELYNTIRFELAVEGLTVLRKLILLENALGADRRAETTRARQWLQLAKNGSYSSSENILKPLSSFNLKNFTSQLDEFLRVVQLPVD